MSFVADEVGFLSSDSVSPSAALQRRCDRDQTMKPLQERERNREEQNVGGRSASSG